MGITSEQGQDIREIKVRLADMSERLDTFEQATNAHFEALEGRIGTLEQSVNSRFEAQDKKLDQVLLLLNTFTAKPGQETE